MVKNVTKKIALTVATTISLFATNGDLMISSGIKSMGMGGVGIAKSFGAESGFANPALLTTQDSSEISISATAFLPDIQTKVDKISTLPLFTKKGKYQDSSSDFYLIPSIFYASPINENWYWGIDMVGVAGMGVDFSDAPKGSGLLKMQSDLMIMNIATPIAYRCNGFSIGVAPILQVGMLDIKYDVISHAHPFDKEIDTNIGAKVGVTYDFDNGLRVGAVYKSPISMEYEGDKSTLKLQQPQEYGVGLSYSFDRHTLSMDLKRVDWDLATGYKDFGWKSQDIFAIGYEYQSDCWALRAGYNYGSSVIDSSKREYLKNYLNLLAFPATAKHHYSVGGSYSFSDRLSLDLALVYSPEEEKNGIIRDTLLRDIYIVNKHSELSVSAQINYKF